MRYQQQLNDPRWKARRKEILARDGNHCKLCGKSERLHIHHIHYEGKAWEARDDYLVTLCPTCHKTVHVKDITIVWESSNFYFDGEQIANHYISQEDVDRLSIDEVAMDYLVVNRNSELGYFICDQRAWDPDMAEEYEYKINGYPEDGPDTDFDTE